MLPGCRHTINSDPEVRAGGGSRQRVSRVLEAGPALGGLAAPGKRDKQGPSGGHTAGGAAPRGGAELWGTPDRSEPSGKPVPPRLRKNQRGETAD
jgi:hypothetical protein